MTRHGSRQFALEGLRATPDRACAAALSSCDASRFAALGHWLPAAGRTSDVLVGLAHQAQV